MRLKIYRVSDGALVQSISDVPNFVTSVAISPDNQYVAAEGRMFRISDAALIHNFASCNLGGGTFSPDGQ